MARLQLAIETISHFRATPQNPDVSRNLCSYALPRLFRRSPLLKGHDQLFKSGRDENAKGNDPELARKLAPAMQRFGQVNAHIAGPPAVTPTQHKDLGPQMGMDW